jgi:hypothetical protein
MMFRSLRGVFKYSVGVPKCDSAVTLGHSSVNVPRRHRTVNPVLYGHCRGNMRWADSSRRATAMRPGPPATLLRLFRTRVKVSQSHGHGHRLRVAPEYHGPVSLAFGLANCRAPALLVVVLKTKMRLQHTYPLYVSHTSTQQSAVHCVYQGQITGGLSDWP